jgi:transcriptional regulator with XRE-family HTH domain
MTPGNAKQLGQLLRQRRQKHGWSTRQLAGRVDLHASTITRLEHGAFLTPKDETVQRLATALGITQADLASISARYVVPAELPEFDDYLSVKYPDLTPAARHELLHRFGELHTISQEVAGWGDRRN